MFVHSQAVGFSNEKWITADFSLLFVRLDKKIHFDEKKLTFFSYQVNWFVLQVYRILRCNYIHHHTPLKPAVPKHVKRSRKSPVKERLSSLNQRYRKARRVLQMMKLRLFFFYVGFLSRTLTNQRAAGEGGGHFINSSLPLPPASQTLKH